jgi:ABC-type molybdate transport system permease subunit
MTASKALRWMVLALAGWIVLLTAAPAFSQSCALCYTQAASSGSKMIAALKSGILILIVPPTVMSVALIFVVHRKNRQVRRTDDSDESSQDW